MSEMPTGLPAAEQVASLTACIHAAGAGDAGALQQMFTVLRGRLLRIVALRTGRQVHDLDPEVEDIVQDALLAALRDFDEQRLDSSGALMRWITTIAMNDVRDRARWRRVRDGLVALRTAMQSAIGDARPTPLEQVFDNELEAATDAAMARLEPEDRDVLLLRNYEGLSAAEIATTLGLRTEEAARARVLRARRRLERELAPFLE